MKQGIIYSMDTDQPEIAFYGPIVPDNDDWAGAKGPQIVTDFLQEAAGRDITVKFNSPGGSVFAGYAIYNMFSTYKGLKTGIVEGMAASMAAVITMAMDKILMFEDTSYLMIHKPWSFAIGTADDLEKQAALLNQLDQSSFNVLANRLKSGNDSAKLRSMVDAETWLDGKQCAELFNHVELVQTKPKTPDQQQLLTLEQEKIKLLGLKNGQITAKYNELTHKKQR